jgi:hypothetical protein
MGAIGEVVRIAGVPLSVKLPGTISIIYWKQEEHIHTSMSLYYLFDVS